MLRENGVTGGGLPTYGTAVLVNIINNTGSFPTRNWQESYFEDADDISGETLKDTYLVRECGMSPLPYCLRKSRKDRRQGSRGTGIRALWAYGGNCGLKDLDAIDRANMWCNEYGLDAISTPCTIAAAMELYQMGVITEEECEGFLCVGKLGSHY